MAGRHTDPDRGAFWRSLALAAGKALLVLALLAALTAAVVAYAGRPSAPDAPAVVFDPTPAATEQAAPTPMPTRVPSPTATLAPSPLTTPTQAPTVVPAPTAAPGSVTVQVLDSGGGPDATRAAVTRLDGFGYDVVAVNLGRCCYEVTTLFYSTGRQAEAVALRDRDPRFAVVEPNPGLAESVDLHVLVGEDWAEP